MGTRAKLSHGMLGAVTIGLCVAVAVFELAFENVIDVLHSALRTRGITLATNLATNIATPLSISQTDQINKALDVFLHHNSDINGVVVSNLDGENLASHGKPIPKEITSQLMTGKEPIYQNDSFFFYTPILHKGEAIGHAIYSLHDQQSNELLLRFRITIALTCFGVLGIVTVLALTLGKQIVLPLKKMSSIAIKLAAGDLSQESIAIKGKDEIAELGAAVNQMANALRKQASAIKQASSQVLANAELMTTSTSELANAAHDQVTAVSQALQIARLVSETGQGTLQSTLHITNTAENSVNVAQKGAEAANISVSDIRRLQTRVEQIAVTSTDVLEKVREANDVVTAVEELAEQSTMLSVNASLEATRAGEAGKGFAVVAREVATLASGSKQATAQVRNTLRTIRKAIEELAKSAHGSRSMAEASMQSIERTGEVIQRLESAIYSTAEASRRIAQNVHDQVENLRQIDEAIDTIGRAAAHNLDSAQHTKQGCEQLSTTAEKLERLVADYKLKL